MTLHRVVESEGFTWVDVVGPSRLELLELARTYDLHPTIVEDCLDPEHLPKHEKIGDATFLILRAHDDAAKDDASSIQELTRKVAMFFRPTFALTVHRVDLHEVAVLRERFQPGGVEEPCTLPLLLFGLGNNVLASYEKPLEQAEAMLDQIEAGLFDGGAPPSLEQAHNLKRRVSLIRRILWQSSQVINRLVPQAERMEPLYQDVRESVEALVFWADQPRRGQQPATGPPRGRLASQQRGDARPDDLRRLLPAADLHRGRLRDELRPHAGAGAALGVSGGAAADGGGVSGDLHLVPAARLVGRTLSDGRAQAPIGLPIPPSSATLRGRGRSASTG